MKDLQCMSFTSKGATEILVAGIQNTMFVIDVVKGEIVKQVGTLLAHWAGRIGADSTGPYRTPLHGHEEEPIHMRRDQDGRNKHA